MAIRPRTCPDGKGGGAGCIGVSLDSGQSLHELASERWHRPRALVRTTDFNGPIHAPNLPGRHCDLHRSAVRQQFLISGTRKEALPDLIGCYCSHSWSMHAVCNGWGSRDWPINGKSCRCWYIAVGSVALWMALSYLGDIQSGNDRAELSLMLRIFWQESRPRMVVQTILGRIWGLSDAIQVYDTGFNLYQVLFDSAEQRQRVLTRQPWAFDSFLMNLIPYEPPSEDLFNRMGMMSLWVKLAGVPFDCCTTAFGKKILPAVGKVQQVALFGTRDEEGIFIKGQVQVDVRAPFLGRIRAFIGEHRWFWVFFQYERVPLICYRCGYLGHGFNHCPLPDTEEWDRDARGDWMCIPAYGQLLDERSLRPRNYARAVSRRPMARLPPIVMAGFAAGPGLNQNAANRRIRTGARRTRDMEVQEPGNRLGFLGNTTEMGQSSHQVVNNAPKAHTDQVNNDAQLMQVGEDLVQGKGKTTVAGEATVAGGGAADPFHTYSRRTSSGARRAEVQDEAGQTLNEKADSETSDAESASKRTRFESDVGSEGVEAAKSDNVDSVAQFLCDEVQGPDLEGFFNNI